MPTLVYNKIDFINIIQDGINQTDSTIQTIDSFEEKIEHETIQVYDSKIDLKNLRKANQFQNDIDFQNFKNQIIQNEKNNNLDSNDKKIEEINIYRYYSQGKEYQNGQQSQQIGQKNECEINLGSQNLDQKNEEEILDQVNNYNRHMQIKEIEVDVNDNCLSLLELKSKQSLIFQSYVDSSKNNNNNKSLVLNSSQKIIGCQNDLQQQQIQQLQQQQKQNCQLQKSCEDQKKNNSMKKNIKKIPKRKLGSVSSCQYNEVLDFNLLKRDSFQYFKENRQQNQVSMENSGDSKNKKSLSSLKKSTLKSSNKLHIQTDEGQNYTQLRQVGRNQTVISQNYVVDRLDLSRNSSCKSVKNKLKSSKFFSKNGSQNEKSVRFKKK
ncbi:hypothetical protein PPERSA_05403 [Pseudocohnilembus persalinus]|uniref:Uncharacterized protein n=1 Tax=Pseudocohnilembus persalinus TaxID=266149 RepID=A0A0V0R7X7_PSEPJ|nr:hypothetical protein PPERSA_05403 [Pseudocohnilembus persalinus]|eukprot:KRX10583.1 hypothetical protein PPERSA_05403 [Pseudocohnilembus persalinus]